MDALQATAMDLDDAAEAPPDPLEVAFEAAANASDPGAAYLAVLTDAEHALTEAGARAKEQCVYKLAERDSKNKNFGDVAVLLERAAPFFGQVAKAKVAKVAGLAVREGVQMHGGIGMTDEFDMGFFMKRARAGAEWLGDYGYHAEQVARLRGF